MRDFKFLSIKAHVDCAQRFLKNLIAGQEYKFYQSFEEVEQKQKNEFQNQLAHQQVPENLYNISTLTGDILPVNISAIVGKNGTGKSSIIELFLASLCVLAIRTGTHDEDITSLEEVLEKLANKTDLKSIKKRDQTQAKLKDLNEMIKGLKAELSFSTNGIVYKLELHPSYESGFKLWIPGVKLADSSFTNDINVDDTNVLEHFFYTIAVNYSHYALNSRHIGPWIDKLFQKNDGYKVPVVIAPMRDEGNFNINTEMHLAKSRLLTNIMIDRSYRTESMPFSVSEKQSIVSIELKLNYKKLEKYFTLDENRVQVDQRKTNMVMDLFKTMFPDDDYALFMDNSFLIELASNYIINKIDKIRENYDGFAGEYGIGEEMYENQNLAFIRSIIEEDSHISYKIRRTANFIKTLKTNGIKDLFEAGDYTDASRLPVYTINIEDLYSWMGRPVTEEVQQRLPPSFFDVDFVLKNENGEPNDFDDLSSGEMHFIHTIQSLIYHINNIQSVHLSKFPRLKYNFVNIILDEIELYFHPDLQRKFVSELRYSLSRLHRNNGEGVDAINILLLTHSPFILSDVPSQNVLLLKSDPSTNKSMAVKSHFQTFAGNINEILSDSFFMESSQMGKFAEEKVESLIRKDADDIEREKILSIIGDSFLKAHIEEFLNG